VLIGSPPFSPFAASAGEIYDLVVFATAGARQAGLFDVRVTGPSSSVVYQSTTPVGAIAAPVAVTLPAAGVWSLTLADTNFPVSLTDTTTSPPPPPAFAAALVQNGAVLGVQTGAGTKSVTAAQGAAQLFTFATSASVGAFSINIAQSGTVAFADVQTVDNSDDPSTDVIYSFAPTQSIGAGGHRFTLKDYRLPQALANLRAALVQSGTVVQRIEQADSINVVLTAGLVKVLVAARPAVTNSVPNNGLFGFELATQSGGTVVAEGTQGVGGLFHSRPLPIDTAGQYDVQLADLQFPQALQTRILAITRGTDLIGQIIGPDSVRQPLQQGTYVLSFLGRPANGLNYGAYGLKVSTPPPAPTLTLTADPTSVTSGQRTTLTWTSTDTTSCTAGGSGWTGTKTLTGTEQSNALNTNTTFTLDCSGPGGSINRSVTIDVTAPSPSGGGGGGGSTGLLLLGVLSVLAFARNRQASSAVRGFP
jgi:hypothetical protein